MIMIDYKKEYKEFIRPNLRLKDGYEHIIVFRYSSDTWGLAYKSKNRVSVEITNLFDSLLVT